MLLIICMLLGRFPGKNVGKQCVRLAPFSNDLC